MAHAHTNVLSLALALLLAAASATAEPQHENEHQGGGRPAEHQGEPHPGAHQGEPRPGPHQGEPHPGPRGYERPAEPHGWNARPNTVDRSAYQHNFQAARSFRVGPYHRPPGWTPRRWTYGQILPRPFWAAPYIIADYWLFALEVPPAGYEWVRSGSDAILVNVDTGEILQVEYGVFA
jgi:Ni/Co efflux regulator RcnB